MVRFPVPGPTSSTTSVLLMPALSTIDCTTSGFFKMCCPLLLWNSMPTPQRPYERQSLKCANVQGHRADGNWLGGGGGGGGLCLAARYTGLIRRFQAFWRSS